MANRGNSPARPNSLRVICAEAVPSDRTTEGFWANEGSVPEKRAARAGLVFLPVKARIFSSTLSLRWKFGDAAPGAGIPGPSGCGLPFPVRDTVNRLTPKAITSACRMIEG
jgi:hypothetical protein